MKKKDRIINIRFLFCVFVGLMIGIVMGKLFLTNKIKLWLLILILLLIACLSFVAWMYGKKTEEYNKQFRARKNLSKMIKFSSVGFAVSVVVGFAIICMPILEILLMPKFDGSVVATGIVSEYVVSEETYQKFVVTDCEIIYGGEKVSLQYDVLIYTSTYLDVSLGDRVTFEGTLTTYDMTDEYGMHSLINNIGYSAYIKSTDIVVGENSISIRDWIHNRVYNLLEDNMNKENADISYAILFGDKNALNDGVSEMFSYAGISHLLAVSGLHVSVLVSIIWFLLDRIKCNKYLKLGVFGGILLFYAYLCYFSPSVCRACIMAFALATCKAFKLEYDSLSSLSLAGIIILLISPEMLFSLSFQLSFMCIFAIISLSPGLNKVLDKIRCPKWLSASLSMSIAVNLAVLPIATNSFGEVSLLGVISNIFVLPIFSVVYVLLFTIVLIGAIISPLGVILKIPEMLLHIIKVIANFVSAIPFGVFRIFNVSYWLVALIVVTGLAIHFVMSKHYLKTVAVVGLVALICVVFGLNLISKKYSNDVIISQQYSSGVVIVSDEDSTSLIGSDITAKTLILMLKELRLKNIDTIFAFDLQLNELKELEKVCKTFNVKKVYIPSKYNYSSVTDGLPKTEILADGKKVCGYTLGIIENDDNIIAVTLENDNRNILMPSLDNKKKDNNYIKTYYLDSADYLLVDDNTVWSDLGDYMGEKHCFEDKDLIIKDN